MPCRLFEDASLCPGVNGKVVLWCEHPKSAFKKDPNIAAFPSPIFRYSIGENSFKMTPIYRTRKPKLYIPPHLLRRLHA